MLSTKYACTTLFFFFLLLSFPVSFFSSSLLLQYSRLLVFRAIALLQITFSFLMITIKLTIQTVHDKTAIDIKLMDIVQEICTDNERAAPNPAGAPNGTEGAGMSDVDVSV